MKARPSSSGLRLAVLLIGMLVFGASFCHADIAVVDDTGGQITIAHPARRIIAIAPNLAELAYAAGAGQWLIAAVRGTDYPPVASLLPRVGDAAGLDFEQIRRLEPDLVLAWGSGNKQSDLDRLARNGVAVVVFEARTLGDVSRHLRMIGRLAGSEREAERAAVQFGNHLARLRATYATNCVVDVFVEIWHQPVFTVGPSHALSDALHVCGARNVAHDYPLLAGPIPLENVLVARPEAILSVTGGGGSRCAGALGQAVAGLGWSVCSGGFGDAGAAGPFGPAHAQRRRIAVRTPGLVTRARLPGQSIRKIKHRRLCARLRS